MTNTFKKYRNKETGEIARIKGFGTSLHPSGKAITMVWVKTEGKEKAEFIRAQDFDANYELLEENES